MGEFYFKNDNDRTAKRIAAVDINNEYQFVKQFWDCDVSTLNFWWVDKTHVLQQTESEFVLWRKTSRLHDWNGDVWEKDRAWPSGLYLPSNVLKHIVTCTNNCSSRLLTFEAFDADTITLRIYDPLQYDDDGMMRSINLDLELKFEELGVKLHDGNPLHLCSYVEQTAYAFLSDVKLSATIVDGKDGDDVGDTLLLGMALDKSLRQWCFQINLKTRGMKLLVGYGHVGPSGQLTGGQFPTEYFNNQVGFNEPVQPVDMLAVRVQTNDISAAFDAGIYGNNAQQWYIKSEIKSIVSHLKWNSDKSEFDVFTINLKNNYSASYASTSFYTNKILGFLPGNTTIGAMLPFDGQIKYVIEVLTRILSPSIYYLTPTWTKFAYLQQSLGQYAYVWYGSNNRSLPPPLRDSDDLAGSMRLLDKDKDPPAMYDELSFDEQERIQKIDGEEQDKLQQIGGFFLALLTNGVSNIIGNAADLVVNKVQGQTVNTEDLSARRLGQFFMNNLVQAAATDIGIQGVNTGMSAKVSAVKTLDMFYSTSADSKCYAGPGFVNHNFVAQCLAQSVSNRYIIAQQNGMLTCIWPLSILECKIRTLGLEAIKAIALAAADSMDQSEGPYAMGSGPGSIVFAIIGGVMKMAAWVAQTIIDANNTFMQILPELVNTLVPNGNATFSPLGAIRDHRIDIEGKHFYGGKNVSLFWPCFGATNTQFTNESVKADIKEISVSVDFSVKSLPNIRSTAGKIDLAEAAIDNVTSYKNINFKNSLNGDLYAQHIYCKGKSETVTYPDGMAVVEGCTSFLPAIPFKNEAIGMAPPVFTPPAVQDYLLSEKWQIGVTAVAGDVAWVFCKDTKVFDGMFSNIAIYNDFCGMACPYAAVEVKDRIHEEYMRPYAVTPQCIALNQTGLNAVYDGRPYHAFDGVGQRIVQWTGSAGMNQQWPVQQHYFQVNDHFKRSNILPPNVFIGNFKGPPVVAVDSRDKVYSSYENTMKGEGLEQGLPGEAKNAVRYSLPVFTEAVSTLPAVVRTLNAHRLNVIDGVTTLTTGLRSMLSSYKAPKSIDFNIGSNLFRVTEEYVCLLDASNNGVANVQNICATLGLEFIGAMPVQAFFYSPATRAYYSFTGSSMVQKQDVWARFRNIRDGRWDFVNQDVVFGCLADMKRLDLSAVDDDEDETDNIFVARLTARGVSGEIAPPERTIFNNESWYKTLSMAGGLVYQGPKRFIVNRFVLNDYMLKDMVRNKGLWKKVPREEFHLVRDYSGYLPEYSDLSDVDGVYQSVDVPVDVAVKGWTHNPFVFVTSPLGIGEDVDCMFEWELTFTWTDYMDKLYAKDEYACVNISAYTYCPGGKKITRPTHVFLTKDLFTRADNSGYYTFRFNSNNGAGNREQLFIWSDSYIAMTALRIEYKPITQRRQTPLTQQLDVASLKEM